MRVVRGEQIDLAQISRADDRPRLLEDPRVAELYLGGAAPV